jgi:hypothetical protein
MMGTGGWGFQEIVNERRMCLCSLLVLAVTFRIARQHGDIDAIWLLWLGSCISFQLSVKPLI